MVAGLAHESRKALQRSQGCLERLELQVADQPRAMELIRRLQEAQDQLHRLYEEVRHYAAPVKLDRREAADARQALEDRKVIERARGH